MRTVMAERTLSIALLYLYFSKAGMPTDRHTLRWANFIVKANHG